MDAQMIPIEGKVVRVFTTGKGKHMAEVAYAFGQAPVAVEVSKERFEKLASVVDRTPVDVKLGLRLTSKAEVIQIAGKQPFPVNNFSVIVQAVSFA